MVTDGGPEHRVNFDSVKIPLILVFTELKLSMLVAPSGTPTPDPHGVDALDAAIEMIRDEPSNIRNSVDLFDSCF